MTATSFDFPTAIRFGVGAAGEVPAHLHKQGVSRPIVVTDRGVAELDFHQNLLASMQGAGLEAASFSGVWGNPVESQVTHGVAAYREHGADAVVGLGGGAALDVAKAVALMATHPGDLFDYEDEMPGARPIEQAPLPWFVAIPTTAGTGSEVGRSAVIADDDTHIKKIIYSPHLLARVVFADPALTVGLPPHITAATGIDALTHNIEAYLAKGFNPLCDGIAVEGVRLCAANLANAVADGSDIEARSAMLVASMMGAVAFQKGLGLVHSCAHALGTAADVHHGLANGLMIDHALRFNVESSADRLEHLALVVGLDPTAEAFLDWLAALKAEVGVAATLRDHGLDGALAAELTRLATEDPCHANNPRPVGAADFADIFARAYG
ncbi:MAG: iron-containing alcohol dehydrogenase [Actinomycetia bacterium]|nr:iron-containing alcohol dehydrogenase [Actinomycetes bacterium]